MARGAPAATLSTLMSQLDLDLATDAELVSRFAAGRDQRAFAQLVARGMGPW
jgi:hypothetical protein